MPRNSRRTETTRSHEPLSNVPLPMRRSILTTMAVWPMCSGGSEKEKTHSSDLIHSLRLDPGYDWAWNTLRGWSTTLKCPDALENLARELTEQRGERLETGCGSPRSSPGRKNSISGWRGSTGRLLWTPVTLSHMISRLNCWRRPAASRRLLRPARRLPGETGRRYRFAAALPGSRHAGRGGGAIAQMRAVLAEDGDYYWGWQNLADWGRDSGKSAV